ncbi:glycosyl hydrolase [Candidatus Sumerlaeota bacterium]|nr:glycosyl hydrolase [Candidatus Sumerlaeota bacterium]
MPSFALIQSTSDRLWNIDEQGVTPGGAGAPNLIVTNQTGQTWKGFGGCFNELGWRMLSGLTPEKRDAVFRDLFAPDGDCRFTFCRVPIGASDYAESWYSLNEHPDDFAMEHFSIERDQNALIPYIREAQKWQPDLKFFASPWGPPTWLKRPAEYHGGSLITEEKYCSAYALYLLKFAQAYKAQGIPIAQIHVQNEPMFAHNFPSCVWTGEQMRDFIRDYMGPLFEREGVDTEIWAGTINGPQGDQLHPNCNHFVNLILEDPEARKHVSGVGYQWAGKLAIQRTRQSWPDLPLMQTENECGDGRNTWDYACYVWDLFYHYITNGAEAYIYWNMALQPEGESTWGWKQNSLITVDPETGDVTCNPEYYVMKHFSRYIRPGAQRLNLLGRWSGYAVGFRDDRSIVLAVRNPFAEAKELQIELPGAARYSCRLQPLSINTLVLAME